MADLPPEEQSPAWGPTFKLVVGLTITTIIGALFIQFRNIIGPLLLAVILAYVLHPFAKWLTQKTQLNWRWSVNLIYLLVVVIVIGMFTALGFAVAQQTQNLVAVVTRFINDLPELADRLSSQSYNLGPFQFEPNQENLNTILNEVLGMVRPAISQTGILVSSVASGTFSILGWGFFIILVSFFILADSDNVPIDSLANIEIPGYDADIRRLARHLSRVWESFLRGQFFLFTATIVLYAALMTILGLRNALAIAILAGLARFVPYVGPFVTWVVTAVVAFIMPTNYFGLAPFQYVILVLVAAIILDQIFDNIITPRLYGHTLGIHPAAVLIAAIIAAKLLGFIGLLMAAPVLATLRLFGRYAVRKMLDLNPWPESENISDKPQPMPGIKLIQSFWKNTQQIIRKRRKRDG